jgi:hypothetical protein
MVPVTEPMVARVRLASNLPMDTRSTKKVKMRVIMSP